MPNFDEPTIGEIAQTHFGLVIPRRRLLRVNHYMLVIVGTVQIVDPGICRGHRVKRIVCARR